MTLPSPDSRSPRTPLPGMTTMPRRPRIVAPTHSMPEHTVASPLSMPSQSPPKSAAMGAHMVDHEHALDFATHSWDLATGGLKTLTAKQELPIRPERHAAGVGPDIIATSRSYLFALVIMVCVVLMLFGGGIVLFVMLQP